MYQRMFAAIVSAVLIVAPVQAHERALLVDDDRLQCPRAQYTTIADAVHDAHRGTTITVCEGTYDGNIVVETRGLTIKARGGPGTVRIEAPGSTMPRFGFAVFADDVRIEGFTISRYGEEPGGAGITVGGVELTSGVEFHPAKRATITNNVMFGAPEGSGIVEGTAVALWQSNGNTVSNNELHHNGSAVTCDTSEQVVIRKNLLHNNGNWGVLGTACTGRVVHNTIYRSGEEAIRMQQSGAIVIEDNVVHDNFAGFYLGDLSHVTVRDNTINTSGDGLVVFDVHDARVTRNDVSDNSTGITVRQSSAIRIETNIADRNMPSDIYEDTPDNPLPAGILIVDSSDMRVRDNQTSSNGYGIRLVNSTGGTFRLNRAHQNRVVDYAWDGSGSHTLKHNACDTALPSRDIWGC